MKLFSYYLLFYYFYYRKTYFKSKVNAGEVLLVTFNYTFCILAKWTPLNWRCLSGISKCLITFCGLIMEIAVLKTLGIHLNDNGGLKLSLTQGLLRTSHPHKLCLCYILDGH